MGKETTARRVGVSAPEVGGVAAGRGAAIAPTACGLGAQIVVSRPRIRDAHTMLAAGIIGAAVGLRVALFQRGWPDMDSDLAVIGLMARHILYHGASPAFFYGQHYNGPLGAYIAAAFFAVFGPTNFALNLSTLPLLVLFLTGTYALGRAAYGPIPALLALLYLALGPAFALLMGSHASVTFAPVAGFGALLLLLVYHRLRAPAARAAGRARILAHYTAIGVIAGLGIWTVQLLLPFVVVALLALAFARGRELLGLPGLALLASLAIGCWPLLAYNIPHGGITLIELAQHEALPSAVARAVPGALVPVIQLVMMLTVGLPSLFGSPRVCLASDDALSSYPPGLATLGARPDLACDGLNLAFSLAILICYALAARQLVRVVLPRDLGHRDGAVPSRPSTAGTARAEGGARHALRGMLVAVAGLSLALDLTSGVAPFFPLTAARYLIPLYVTVPVVFGVLWERAVPVVRPVAAVARRRSSRRRVQPLTSSRPRSAPVAAARPGRVMRAALAGAALLALLACAGYGTVRSVAFAGDARMFALPAAPADQRLLNALRARGITRFAAPYWTCYRLVFESGERAVCAVHADDGALYCSKPDNNRYWPFVLLLRQTAHPAYVFLAGSPEDTGFVRDAAAHGWPHAGYTRITAASFAVYFFPGGQG
ncbi:MAG TPA: hypothetical protein VIC85_01575 [Ktedonobacterales bacterium]